MATLPSTGTYRPNYVFEERMGYVTNVLPFESGKEARYSRGSPRREWTLVYSNADDTTRDALLDFFKARQMSTNSFDWVNPNDSTSYTARLSEDSVTVETIDYGIHNITLTLVEVI